MADEPDIAELVNDAVAAVFAAHLPTFRDEVSKAVLESLNPVIEQHRLATQRSKEGKSGTSSTDLLNVAVGSIYDSVSQSDILKSLLGGVSQFCARVALFVVKGNALNAWRSAGFPVESAFKGLTLDASAGLAGRAIRDREAVSAAAKEFNSDFIRAQGSPSDGNANILPLVVRGKVAAIVYTDAGTQKEGKSDTSAARLLVRAASSWLEINALRKAGASAGEGSAAEPSSQAEPTELPPRQAAPSKAGGESKRDEEAEPEMSKEDQELHKKAKRFARLLVDEIKLYNPARVAEGKQKKDLYERLREDIEKSRSTYEKRYGSTSAGKAGYFNAEVVRILGENDLSVLGSGFPQ